MHTDKNSGMDREDTPLHTLKTGMIIENGDLIMRNWALLNTGGGQKLRTGSLVLPVADSIFK